MSWVAVCHECGGAEPPADAYGEGHNAAQAEADAYRKAFEHVRDTGHRSVFVCPGSYYIGEGERPTEFPRVFPPEEVYDKDGVARDLWNDYPEPLNLLLVDVLKLNRSYWFDSIREDTYGAELVRRQGLTENQREWAEAIADVMPDRHPEYPELNKPYVSENASLGDTDE